MTPGKRTKKELQAQETRHKILVAATKLIARQGYHKTTVADIAQAIHLTTGAFFYHYPSKEDLLCAVVDRLARGIQVYSDYLKDVETGSLNVVCDVINIMVNHFKRQPEATICLAALATEFAGSNHRMEARLKEIYESFVETFAHMLRNHPKVSDPRAAAIAFAGAVQGIAIQGLLRENEVTIDELANAFLTMFADW